MKLPKIQIVKVGNGKREYSENLIDQMLITFNGMDDLVLLFPTICRFSTLTTLVVRGGKKHEGKISTSYSHNGCKNGSLFRKEDG